MLGLIGRCPCLRCSVKIVQCGVLEVVYNQSYSMDVASAMVLKEGRCDVAAAPHAAMKRTLRNHITPDKDVEEMGKLEPACQKRPEPGIAQRKAPRWEDPPSLRDNTATACKHLVKVRPIVVRPSCSPQPLHDFRLS